MYITIPPAYPSLQSYSASTQVGQVDNSEFSAILEQNKVMLDIAERLRGVPSDTVSIPPSIMKQMAENEKMYNHVMRAIDEYVSIYKSFNVPGVCTITFSMDEKGMPCVTGVNEEIKKQCEDSNKKKKTTFGSADTINTLPMQTGLMSIPLESLSASAALYDMRIKRYYN